MYIYVCMCIRMYICIYSLIPAVSSVLEKRNKDPNAPKKALSDMYYCWYSYMCTHTIGTYIYGLELI